jgi:hypothetical protein
LVLWRFFAKRIPYPSKTNSIHPTTGAFSLNDLFKLLIFQDVPFDTLVDINILYAFSCDSFTQKLV